MRHRAGPLSVPTIGNLQPRIHMGWGRMLLLGNIGQQMDIDEVKDYLNRAIVELNKGEEVDADQNRALHRLTEENRELKLYVLALTRLLTQKRIVTHEELTAMVTAVEQTSPNQA